MSEGLWTLDSALREHTMPPLMLKMFVVFLDVVLRDVVVDLLFLFLEAVYAFDRALHRLAFLFVLYASLFRHGFFP